jgi:hypothetical protein
LKTIERDLAELPYTIRDDVVSVAERIEGGVERASQEIVRHDVANLSSASSQPHNVPDLFEHLSPSDEGMRDRERRRRKQSNSMGQRISKPYKHHAHGSAPSEPSKKHRSHSRTPRKAGQHEDHRGNGDHDDVLTSLGEESTFDQHAFEHPSIYQEQKWIWIPKDIHGFSTVLVEDLEAAGVKASDGGAGMNDQGIVYATRSPPDQPWHGGVDD